MARTCVIVSGNRFDDIAPYGSHIYTNDPQTWGQIFPWEFPQNASREDEEAFINRYFTAEEIHLQGGATGAGNGYKFLKQVWYSLALFNFEHRVPAFTKWWMDKPSSVQLLNDTSMQPFLLRDDVQPSTFFSDEIPIYGDKFLTIVIPYLQHTIRDLLEKRRAEERPALVVDTAAAQKSSVVIAKHEEQAEPMDPTSASPIEATQSAPIRDSHTHAAPYASKSPPESAPPIPIVRPEAREVLQSSSQILHPPAHAPSPSPSQVVPQSRKRGNSGTQRGNKRPGGPLPTQTRQQPFLFEHAAQAYFSPQTHRHPSSFHDQHRAFSNESSDFNMPQMHDRPQHLAPGPETWQMQPFNPPMDGRMMHAQMPQNTMYGQGMPMHRNNNPFGDRSNQQKPQMRGFNDDRHWNSPPGYDGHRGNRNIQVDSQGMRGGRSRGGRGRSRGSIGGRSSFHDRPRPHLQNENVEPVGWNAPYGAAPPPRNRYVSGMSEKNWRSGSDDPQAQQDQHHPMSGSAFVDQMSAVAGQTMRNSFARMPMYDMRPPQGTEDRRVATHPQHPNVERYRLPSFELDFDQLPESQRCGATWIGPDCTYAIRLVVLDVPRELDSRYMVDFFSQFGHVQEVFRPLGNNGQPSLKAFVSFATAAQARACLLQRPAFWLENRPLKVQVDPFFWEHHHPQPGFTWRDEQTSRNPTPVRVPSILKRPQDGVFQTVNELADQHGTDSEQNTPTPSGANTPRKSKRKNKNKQKFDRNDETRLRQTSEATVVDQRSRTPSVQNNDPAEPQGVRGEGKRKPNPGTKGQDRLRQASDATVIERQRARTPSTQVKDDATDNKKSKKRSKGDGAATDRTAIGSTDAADKNTPAPERSAQSPSSKPLPLPPTHEKPDAQPSMSDKTRQESANDTTPVGIFMQLAAQAHDAAEAERAPAVETKTSVPSVEGEVTAAPNSDGPGSTEEVEGSKAGVEAAVPEKPTEDVSKVVEPAAENPEEKLPAAEAASENDPVTDLPRASPKLQSQRPLPEGQVEEKVTVTPALPVPEDITHSEAAPGPEQAGSQQQSMTTGRTERKPAALEVPQPLSTAGAKSPALPTSKSAYFTAPSTPAVMQTRSDKETEEDSPPSVPVPAREEVKPDDGRADTALLDEKATADETRLQPVDGPKEVRDAAADEKDQSTTVSSAPKETTPQAEKKADNKTGKKPAAPSKIEHTPPSAKPDKPKGPAQTESLSLFGKKKEKKPKPAKKGTMKGKPKGFDETGSAEFGGAATKQATRSTTKPVLDNFVAGLKKSCNKVTGGDKTNRSDSKLRVTPRASIETTANSLAEAMGASPATASVQEESTPKRHRGIGGLFGFFGLQSSSSSSPLSKPSNPPPASVDVKDVLTAEKSHGPHPKTDSIDQSDEQGPADAPNVVADVADPELTNEAVTDSNAIDTERQVPEAANEEGLGVAIDMSEEPSIPDIGLGISNAEASSLMEGTGSAKKSTKRKKRKSKPKHDNDREQPEQERPRAGSVEVLSEPTECTELSDKLSDIYQFKGVPSSTDIDKPTANPPLSRDDASEASSTTTSRQSPGASSFSKRNLSGQSAILTPKSPGWKKKQRRTAPALRGGDNLAEVEVEPGQVYEVIALEKASDNSDDDEVSDNEQATHIELVAVTDDDKVYIYFGQEALGPGGGNSDDELSGVGEGQEEEEGQESQLVPHGSSSPAAGSSTASSVSSASASDVPAAGSADTSQRERDLLSLLVMRQQWKASTEETKKTPETWG